jgi:hypothetical protein
MVRAGQFREDLYYRVRVVPITLVPLRQRREDIPLLVEHFLRRFAAKTGRPLRQLAPATMQALLTYDYPGNIRELEERAGARLRDVPRAADPPCCLPEEMTRPAGLPGQALPGGGGLAPSAGGGEPGGGGALAGARGQPLAPAAHRQGPGHRPGHAVAGRMVLHGLTTSRSAR